MANTKQTQWYCGRLCYLLLCFGIFLSWWSCLYMYVWFKIFYFYGFCLCIFAFILRFTFFRILVCLLSKKREKKNMRLGRWRKKEFSSKRPWHIHLLCMPSQFIFKKHVYEYFLLYIYTYIYKNIYMYVCIHIHT